MKNLPSKLPLAAAVTTLGCLALVVFLTPAAQAQQSEAIQAELQQQMRAELQQQMEAELRQRMQAEMLQAQELNKRLAEQAGAVQLRRAEEEMRRNQESLARAEQELRQGYRRASTLRLRGGCDAFGETVVDFAEELELTDDQIDQIRAAQRATRRAAIERNADIEVGEMDLEALYEADTPDLTAIRAQLEGLAMLSVDQQMAGLNLREQVRGLLSQAQREQLPEMRMSDDVRIVISGVGSNWQLGNIGC